MKTSQLRVSLVLLVSFILVLGVASTGIRAQEYKQAPELKKLVESGDLPPVTKRLPDNPKVVEPEGEVGKFGGTLRTSFMGAEDYWFTLKQIGAWQEKYLFINRQGEVEPNLVTEWEYLDEGRTVRLHIRKGVKWSDGESFTVDDIIYSLKLKNREGIGCGKASWENKVKPDGIEKVDDYTVEIPLKSAHPFEFTASAGYIAAIPEHYLKDFDPKYNEDMTKDDLYEHWAGRASTITKSMVEYPTLAPWKVVGYSKSKELVLERNPYFWKIDTEGNQLPYIDRVKFIWKGGEDAIPPAIVAGSIDIQYEAISMGQYDYFRQREGKGNYNTVVLTTGMLGTGINLNWTTPDETLRELFNKKDFRIALSIAIDREGFSEQFYFGQAEPWSRYVLRESPYFAGEKWAKMHTEYDPKRAQKLLSDLGLEDTDGDDLLEYKGEDVSIEIIYQSKKMGAGSEEAQMISRMWQGIGIDVVLNPLTVNLKEKKVTANNYDAYLNAHTGGAITPLRLPLAWSLEKIWSNPGTLYARWYQTDGEEGVEPVSSVKEINEKFHRCAGMLERDKRIKCGKELMKLYPEAIWGITTTNELQLMTASKQLGNVPLDKPLVTEATRHIRGLRPWQFYFKDLERRDNK